MHPAVFLAHLLYLPAAFRKLIPRLADIATSKKWKVETASNCLQFPLLVQLDVFEFVTQLDRHTYINDKCKLKKKEHF